VNCTPFDRTPAIAGGPRNKPGHMPMSDTFSKVEVITGVASRRRFSTDQKLAVVAETMQPGMSISYVARRHGLSPSLVFRWRRLMSEGGKEAVRAGDEVVAAAELRRLEERVRELERLLGRKTMEVEILKEALELARCRALEHYRTPRRCETPPRTAVASRRRRVRRHNQPPGRRATDLRVPADRRTPQARAAIRRHRPGQRQARLPADEQA